MTTSYETIYSCFLANITDYDFINLSEDVANDFLKDWLHSTVAKPYVNRIFSSVSLDDETMVITYELRNSVSEVDNNNDEYFACEILSKGMIIEWLQPKVNSILNTAQMFGGKEQSFYSQSNHLHELRTLLEDTKLTVRQMIRDHGYINNSYIRGE